jgi:hypothetical protein
LAILGALLGPGFWVLKWILTLLHVLRVSATAGPQTLTDHIFDAGSWNVIGVILLGLALCSLVVLYVIVCPPPRDIDQ